MRLEIFFISDDAFFLFDLYRRKLSVRIQELEDLLEQTRLRCTNLERTKSKLTAELKEVTIELENVSPLKRFQQQTTIRDSCMNTRAYLCFWARWLCFIFYFSVKSSSKTSLRETDSWRMRMLLSRNELMSWLLRMPNSATTNMPLNRRCTDSRSPTLNSPRRMPTSREKTRAFLVIIKHNYFETN